MISERQQGEEKYYSLITGAGCGIGRALAVECASRSQNLLLVALPGKELNETQTFIRNNFDVECYCLGIDLSQHCSATEVFNWTKKNKFKVNVLINNVGIGSKGAFEEMPVEFYYTQLNLNVVNTCILTRVFIDELKLNTPSYILNVGSLGGFFSIPDKVVYSASKSFVHSFSKSLRLELREMDISVSLLCPGGTDSNRKTIASNKDLKGFAKLSVLQPEVVAREGIEGMMKKKATIIPGFFNRAYFHLSKISPQFVEDFFVLNAFKHVKKHSY